MVQVCRSASELSSAKLQMAVGLPAAIFFCPQSWLTKRKPALLNNARQKARLLRSEEHTSELQSLMRISYAVFCLKNKKFFKYDQLFQWNSKVKYNVTVYSNMLNTRDSILTCE